MAAPNLTRVPRRSPVLDGEFISQDYDTFLQELANRVRTSAVGGTFANNVDALAGGLAVGQYYQTATGEVRVVV